MALKIYNVMTRMKEDFVPLTPGAVKMYACGITVSGDAHVGHAYQSVVFDVITRYLRYLGLDVTYVRNYTDVDDNIIKNANAIGQDPRQFAEEHIVATDAQMDALGNNRPTVMARATHCIDDIIHFIEKLIASGHAYATDLGDVYFKLDTFPGYGKLSHIRMDKNEIAVRKDLEPGKENEMDFALWKSAKPGEIYWESPWGRGRPGWHIECSAMNMRFLGEQIDIHGGGRDLVFPHHENEIAQTESVTGKQFAKYWVHCGLVKINGQKMSKSLGNGILLRDMLAQYDADTIRFALLRNVYMNDIDITDNFFPDARRHVYRMYSTLARAAGLDTSRIDADKTAAKIAEITTDFERAMDDNFNTATLIATAFGWFDFIDGELRKPASAYDLAAIAAKIVELFGVLNILQQSPSDYIAKKKTEFLTAHNITPEFIAEKLAARAAAKQNRDFALSDSLRDELLAMGLEVRDTPNGAQWDIKL